MNLLGPLASRDFRVLFTGQLVSLIGSAVAPIALAFAVLDLTGSATDLGLVLAASWIPQILFILLGGVVGDRLPRHLVMVGANLVSAAAQGAVALLLLTGAANIWHLAALQVVRGIAVAFFFPASESVVPQVVERPLFQQANALLRLTNTGSAIAGAAMGGIAVAAVGPGWALAWDAATYLASAVILTRIRIGGVLRLGEQQSLLRELAEGWREFRSREWLWVIVAGAAVGNLVWMAGSSVLGPVVAKRYLGGPAALGAIFSCQAAGLLVGGVVALRLRPRRPLFVGVIALLPVAGLLAAYASFRSAAPIAALAFVSGLGLELFSVYWATALQQHIPPAVLSRVSSYDALGSFVFIPIGLTIAGPLAGALGLSAALWTFAVVQLAALAAMLLSRDVRTLRRHEEQSPHATAVATVEPPIAAR